MHGGLGSNISWKVFLFKGRLEPRFKPKLLHHSYKHKPSLMVRFLWCTPLPRVISQHNGKHSPPQPDPHIQPACPHTSHLPGEQSKSFPTMGTRHLKLQPFPWSDSLDCRATRSHTCKEMLETGNPTRATSHGKAPPLLLWEKGLCCFNASQSHDFGRLWCVVMGRQQPAKLKASDSERNVPASSKNNAGDFLEI